MKEYKPILIARKEWREAFRSRQLLMSMMIMPLLFSLLLPVALFLITRLASFVDNVVVPPFLMDLIPGAQDMTLIQLGTVFFVQYLFPVAILIVPVATTSVLSANSFAGEKERKTIEALVLAPVSDLELFLGKVLASLIPSLTMFWISFGISVVSLTLVSYPIVGQFLLFEIRYLILAIFLGPSMSVLVITITVLVSARVQTSLESQQITGALILPVVFFMLGAVTGVLVMGVYVIAISSVITGTAAISTLYLAVKMFRRDRIIEKML
ncbi:MAG: ABC transporter permease subunit [Candidatus Thorarchaeota archaeon]